MIVGGFIQIDNIHNGKITVFFNRPTTERNCSRQWRVPQSDSGADSKQANSINEQAPFQIPFDCEADAICEPDEA